MRDFSRDRPAADFRVARFLRAWRALSRNQWRFSTCRAIRPAGQVRILRSAKLVDGGPVFSCSRYQTQPLT